MDIRDYLRESREITSGYATNRLINIVELQRNLVSEYQIIEKLPNFPVEISTRENQVLLKDLSSRVIEELGEGYQNWENLVVLSGDTSNNRENILYNCYNLTEELADAHHFIIEMLLASVEDPEDLLWNNIFPYLNRGDRKGFLDRKTGVIELLYMSFLKQVEDIPYLELDALGVSNMGQDIRLAGVVPNLLLKEVIPAFWEVTYMLQLCRNTLKNKPWKQAEVLSDNGNYTQYLCWAYYNLVELMILMGLNPYTIEVSYRAKNKVNLFRINSQY